jgi:hypothetical protein
MGIAVGIACLRYKTEIGGNRKADYMLWTIAVILGILWLLGLVSSYTMGGVIHLFLVVAVILVLFRLFTGRRVA